MRRRLFYAALAVIFLNGFLLIALFDVALANDAVDEVRVPAFLLIAAIAEGVIALIMADKRWHAEVSEKNRRREYHRYVCEKGKNNERPLSYAAYCELLMAGRVTVLLEAGTDKLIGVSGATETITADKALAFDDYLQGE